MHVHAGGYCFGQIIQEDLDSIAGYWNSQRFWLFGRDSVGGIPDKL